MLVNCVILGPRASKRYSLDADNVAVSTAYDVMKSNAFFCIHSDVIVDPVTHAETRKKCRNHVIPGKANGWLCRDHQRDLLEHPYVKLVDPGISARLIADVDRKWIADAVARQDPKMLRLTDFRACRRLWNKQGGVDVREQLEAPPLVEEVFFGEDNLGYN